MGENVGAFAGLTVGSLLGEVEGSGDSIGSLLGDEEGLLEGVSLGAKLGDCESFGA